MPGIILVASYTMVHELEKPILRYGVLGAFFGLMFLQAYSYNFVYEADQENPHVYAHPTEDVFTIESKIYDISDYVDVSVFVMASDDDYWPFPWYLRHLNNVGYWDHVPDNVGDASIILVSPDLESDLIQALYENVKPGESSLFLPLFETNMALRPGVNMLSFIKKNVHDIYVNSRVN